MHTLPHWLVQVGENGVGPLCDRLSDQFETAHPSLGERARELIVARTRRGKWLPDGADWLGTEEQRGFVLRHGYPAAMTQGSRRLQFAELTALAPDLPALKGHRHHLVKFVSELLRRVNLAGGNRIAVASSDVRALLEALLRQLPHPDFDSGLTQNDILEFAREQLAGNAMGAEDRGQVLASLLPLVGSLGASRFSGPRDVQGEAIQTVAAAINHLPAPHCAPLLCRILDLSVGWSMDRRSASGEHVPHTRSQVSDFVGRQFRGNRVTLGGTALKAGTKCLAGRPGVQVTAAEIVGSKLESLMTFGAPVSTARALLPVCLQVLQGEGPIPGDRRKLRSRALASLAHGGLPLGESPGERGHFIEQGLGRDPALRTEAAQWFTRACLGKHSKPDCALRVAAARYLHHLLEVGGHTLGTGETEVACRAILDAVRTTPAGLEATAMMCAMLAEIEAAGADQSGARGSYPAHEGLATALACGAIKGFHMIDPGEAAELMRHVVSAYGDMSAADRAEVDTQLMRRFISHAANVGALTLRQLLTAWCNSLPAQAPREAGQLREAWERALPRLGPPAADVVNAFMHVAAGSAPALQLPRPTRPVGHAAACELAAALSRMDVASMQAALRCIGRAELPGELRNEVTRNVLQQYPRMQIDLRPAALDLCFSWDPARTLHMLADRVGRREIQSGKVLWSSLLQSIPMAASGQTHLRRELLLRPAGDVLPALEVLAERHAAAMPKVHREAIADVLATRCRDCRRAAGLKTGRQADRLNCRTGR